MKSIVKVENFVAIIPMFLEHGFKIQLVEDAFVAEKNGVLFVASYAPSACGNDEYACGTTDMSLQELIELRNSKCKRKRIKDSLGWFTYHLKEQSETLHIRNHDFAPHEIFMNLERYAG